MPALVAFFFRHFCLLPIRRIQKYNTQHPYALLEGKVQRRFSLSTKYNHVVIPVIPTLSRVLYQIIRQPHPCIKYNVILLRTISPRHVCLIHEHNKAEIGMIIRRGRGLLVGIFFPPQKYTLAQNLLTDFPLPHLGPWIIN